MKYLLMTTFLTLCSLVVHADSGKNKDASKVHSEHLMGLPKYEQELIEYKEHWKTTQEKLQSNIAMKKIEIADLVAANANDLIIASARTRLSEMEQNITDNLSNYNNRIKRLEANVEQAKKCEGQPPSCMHARHEAHGNGGTTGISK